MKPMLIPPRYTLTNEISQLLNRIEAARAVIEAITIPPELEVNIRRQSTLKSALYSARIEGSELTMEDLPGSPNQKKAEVYNILKATNWLFEKRSKDLSLADILQSHKIALGGLTESAGAFRHEVNAIFNTAGIAIYLPPPPGQVKPLIERLLKYANGTKEVFVPIKATLAHFIFEKIHPFLDGNGRVGRLIMQKILLQGGYGMKGLLSIEEYLDNHRSEYYRSLEEPEKELSDYVEFMLTALAETAEQAKVLVQTKQKAEATDYLLPRRAEIFNIVRDQKIINFDQIRRRFMAVNERTLRYDLKQLQNAGLIRKRGTTKGVHYEIIE
jgi:Fic family protein